MYNGAAHKQKPLNANNFEEIIEITDQLLENAELSLDRLKEAAP